MFGMGMGEILVILIVALLFLGPDKLPEAAKQIGKGIRQLRRHTQDLQEHIEQDETVGGAVRELKSVLRGDEVPARRPLPKPQPAAGAVATGDKPATPAGAAAPAATAEVPPVATAEAPPVATAEAPPAATAEAPTEGSTAPKDPGANG